MKQLGKDRYDFQHPSLREFCKKEMPEEVKVEFHKKAARCLTPLMEDSPGDVNLSLVLSDHLFEGKEFTEAFELNLRLGKNLYDLFDFSFALDLTNRALRCADGLKKGSEFDKSRLAGAFHQKAMILQEMFRHDEALDHYRQSLAIEREIGDRAGEAMTLGQLGRIHEKMNRLEESLSFYQEALKVFQEFGDKRYMQACTEDIQRVQENMHK